MKIKKPILILETPVESIIIKENIEYSWCKQHGFFKQEDDDIFAWYPGSYENGTPSSFSKRNILNISDNNNSYPTPKTK